MRSDPAEAGSTGPIAEREGTNRFPPRIVTRAGAAFFPCLPKPPISLGHASFAQRNPRCRRPGEVGSGTACFQNAIQYLPYFISLIKKSLNQCATYSISLYCKGLINYSQRFPQLFPHLRRKTPTAQMPAPQALREGYTAIFLSTENGRKYTNVWRHQKPRIALCDQPLFEMSSSGISAPPHSHNRSRRALQRWRRASGEMRPGARKWLRENREPRDPRFSDGRDRPGEDRRGARRAPPRRASTRRLKRRREDSGPTSSRAGAPPRWWARWPASTGSR
jgi:hypothetical protein